jgi:hypothetical protein
VSLIRPLERPDLPEVARLYELVARSGRSTPAPGLAPYFARVLLDQPWADPEIPSLVHLDHDGAIVAFQGSSVRRARFDGRPIKIACAGQLVAHPAARHRAVGALLLRAYLGGVQALTITDTASDQMRQIWTLCGGEMVHAACVEWVRVLRPLGSAEWFLRERRKAWPRPVGGRLLGALDAAATRRIGLVSPPPAPDTTAEPLTAAGLVEHLPLVGDRVRLHLDYDERYVSWLFEQLAAVSGLGAPVAHLVSEPGGRVLGWYVYYRAPRGVSQVLLVAAPDREVGRVLDHLLYDAWAAGTVAVRGRIEPRLLEPLSRRRCAMRYAGTLALAHSRDAELLGAMASGRSLLSRLDGEWWIQDLKVDLGALV